MKQILTTIFFLAVVQIVFGQGWDPLQESYTYNYRKPVVDSVMCLKLSDALAVNKKKCYTLNNYIDNCNGYKITNGHVYLPIYVKKPLSSFKLHYLKDKALAQFAFGNDTSNLKPLARVGDVWAFDSARQAHVLDKKYIHFLDFDDSVKTILIGNLDTILLSKQYGILKYPLFNKYHHHYNLIGIEPTDHGFHYPYARDIFNFNVGDSFEYYFDNYSSRGIQSEFIDINTPFQHITGLQQWSITKKEVFADQIKYTYKGYQTISGKVSRVGNSVLIYFQDGRFMGKQAYEGILENGIFGRSNSYLQSSTTYNVPLSPGSDTLGEVYDPNIELSQGKTTYLNGLGCSYLYYNDGLTGTAELTLTSYRKGKQRSGAFKPIDTTSLIPPPKPITEFNISIGPVPVNNLLHVNYESPTKEVINIGLADMNGNIVLPLSQRTISKGKGVFQLDLRAVANGIYFLKLDGDGINKSYRIVVIK